MLSSAPCQQPRAYPQECEGPQSPNWLLCRSPAFPIEIKPVPGNLSVLLDGAADRWLFRLRYFPQPQMFSFGQQGERYQLKPGDNEIKVNVRGGARRAGGVAVGPAGLRAVCPGSNWGWTLWLGA